MYCRKCGKVIISGLICQNCGYHQKQMKYVDINNAKKQNIPEKEKAKSKKSNNISFGINKKYSNKGIALRAGFIITAILMCVGIGIYGYMYFFGSVNVERQSKKIINLIDERKFSEALDFYNKKLKESDSAETAANLSKEMEKRYEDILDEYNHETINNEQMDCLMTLLEDIPLTDGTYFDFYNRFSALYSSKKSYSQALTAVEEKNYEQAVGYLLKVTESDLNYSEAKEQLKNTISKMINETDNPANAFNILESYSVYFSPEEFNSFEQSITDAVVKAADEKVNTYLNAGKYDEAKEYLNNLSKEYPDISVLKDKIGALKNVYIQNVKLNAQKYFNEKDYGKAASTINAALVQLGDDNTELKDLYREYKSYLGVYIDEMVTLQNDGVLEIGEDMIDNAGNTYTHSFSFSRSVEYLLDGKYSNFSGTIALPMSNKNTLKEYYYEIYGDEQLIYTSSKFTGGTLPTNFSIDISGVKIMKIKISMIFHNQYGWDDGELYYGQAGSLLIYDGLLTRNTQ